MVGHGCACAVITVLALLTLVPTIHATRKLQQASPNAPVIPRKFIVQLHGNSTIQKASAAPSSADALVAAVQSADIPVRKVRAYDSDIFHGVAIAAETDEAADKLLARLNEDSRVSAIYPVTTITLPRPVTARPRRRLIAAAGGAEDANKEGAAAAGQAEAGATVDGLITTPELVTPTSHLMRRYAPGQSRYLEQSGGAKGEDVAIAADKNERKVAYPDFELPLGMDGESVRLTPSQSWGVADALTNVAMLRQEHGLTGKGVRIGIIDSGIDYTHPAFGNCTAVNVPVGKCRVVAGYDFVGDVFNLPTDSPQPKANPMDCSEVHHGTSVAGVAAAGYVSGAPMIGVAPEAQLGVYKVYGCGGTGTTDALLAAIQRAVGDGMDIINLSLGEPSGYAAEPWKSIMAAVFAKGIIITRTAGNDGSVDGGQGLFYADGHTATGALVVGGLNTASADVRYIGPSAFSSLGPDPELNLLPHVLGPAEQFITTYAKGQYTTRDRNSPMEPVSGTSFAAPYTAGAIALALQLHRQHLDNVPLPGIAALQQLSGQQGRHFNQQFVNDQLIRTAQQWDASGLPMSESTAKQGAGSFDIGAFVTNPVITTPPFITLPSNFTIHRQQVTLYYTPTNTNQTVNNTGNNMGDGQITYKVTHEGAAAYQLPTKDGWGREPLTPFDNTVLDITASVRVSPEYVTLLPGDRKSVTVTFFLPQMLKKKPLLYSGYLKLVPVSSIPPRADNTTAEQNSSSSSGNGGGGGSTGTDDSLVSDEHSGDQPVATPANNTGLSTAAAAATAAAGRLRRGSSKHEAPHSSSSSSNSKKHEDPHSSSSSISRKHETSHSSSNKKNEALALHSSSSSNNKHNAPHSSSSSSSNNKKMKPESRARHDKHRKDVSIAGVPETQNDSLQQAAGPAQEEQQQQQQQQGNSLAAAAATTTEPQLPPADSASPPLFGIFSKKPASSSAAGGGPGNLLTALGKTLSSLDLSSNDGSSSSSSGVFTPLHLDQATAEAAAVAAAKIVNGAISGVMGRRWLLESQKAQQGLGLLSPGSDNVSAVNPAEDDDGAITDLERSILSSSSRSSSSSDGYLAYQVDGLPVDDGSSSSSSRDNGLSGYQVDGLPDNSSSGSSSVTSGPGLFGYQPDGFFDQLANLFDTTGDAWAFEVPDNITLQLTTVADDQQQQQQQQKPSQQQQQQHEQPHHKQQQQPHHIIKAASHAASEKKLRAAHDESSKAGTRHVNPTAAAAAADEHKHKHKASRSAEAKGQKVASKASGGLPTTFSRTRQGKGLIAETVPHHRLPAADGQQVVESAAGQSAPAAAGKGLKPSTAQKGLITESVPHHRLTAAGVPIGGAAAAAIAPAGKGESVNSSTEGISQLDALPKGLIAETVPHHRLTADGQPIHSSPAAAVNASTAAKQPQSSTALPKGLIAETVPHHRLTADGQRIDPALTAAAADAVSGVAAMQSTDSSKGMIAETVPHHRLDPQAADDDFSRLRLQDAAATASGQTAGGAAGSSNSATAAAAAASSASESGETVAVAAVSMERKIHSERTNELKEEKNLLRHREAGKAFAHDADKAEHKDRGSSIDNENQNSSSDKQQDVQQAPVAFVPSNSKGSSNSGTGSTSAAVEPQNGTKPLSAALDGSPRVQAVPLVIPYQGIVGYSTSLPVTMRSGTKTNVFCYTPNTNNVLSGVAINPAMRVLEYGCQHMSLADSAYYKAAAVEVPLSQIQQFPCALTFTLAPVLPVRRMTVELLDSSSAAKILGTIQTLDTPSYSRSPAGTPYSYCMDWRGNYSLPDGSSAQIKVGQEYGMRVQLEAPLAAADRDAGLLPRIVPVDIQGRFKVIEG